VWHLPLHNGAEVKKKPKAIFFVEYSWNYKTEKMVSCMVKEASSSTSITYEGVFPAY
jgi:hypothetical protein